MPKSVDTSPLIYTKLTQYDLGMYLVRPAMLCCALRVFQVPLSPPPELSLLECANPYRASAEDLYPHFSSGLDNHLNHQHRCRIGQILFDPSPPV